MSCSQCGVVQYRGVPSGPVSQRSPHAAMAPGSVGVASLLCRGTRGGVVLLVLDPAPQTLRDETVQPSGRMLRPVPSACWKSSNRRVPRHASDQEQVP